MKALARVTMVDCTPVEPMIATLEISSLNESELVNLAIDHSGQPFEIELCDAKEMADKLAREFQRGATEATWNPEG